MLSTRRLAAVTFLDAAWTQGGPWYLNHANYVDPIRADPRVHSLLRSLNLPAEVVRKGGTPFRGWP
ncbi:MAG: hypothetical protein WA688_02970 [Thermoplasmata archaeon]